jgi:FimV-like protein
MSRGHNPLLWMMAAALPTAGHALGLGEIHVDSALNEPLAAEIDIVGATPDELVGLIATVANRETFAHFAAERPSFLNTTTFKVTKDASGKPVLAVRSSESFTEPLIDFVVDLRWRNGQLIRQYSLLLDPAGYPAATQSAAALPAPATQSALAAPLVLAAPSTSPAPSAAATSLRTTQLAPRPLAAESGAAIETTTAVSMRTMTQIKVGPKATLRGIAWRIGARSDADLNQMMIAIYRANSSAFNGNINQLRLGATLKIPSAEEVGAISHTDANRETHAQMQAWRDGPKHPAVSVAAAKVPAPAVSAAGAAITSAAAANTASAALANAAPVATPAAKIASANTASTNSVPAAADTAATTSSPAASPSKTSEATGDKAALTTKILSLEGSLQEIQAQLEAQHNKLLSMQAQVRYAEQHPRVVAAPTALESSNRGLLTAAFAGMAALAGVCVALLMRLRRRAKSSTLPSIEKVPAVAPVEAFAPAPVARPKPVPVVVRAPVPAPIEVHEEPAEPRVEARTAKAELRPEEQHEPNESALELSAADTSGINAAKLREELAAAKLREEIAAAWALPSAESYKREDMNHESTLAQDIAKSLEDTMKLEAAMATGEGDTIEEEAFTDTISHTDTGTIVGAVGETASFTATEVLPESTMKMSPSDFPKELDPDHLDYNFMDLEQPSESEVADTVSMQGDVTTASTDRIKVTGELKLATDELKLGADDPKNSAGSIEDELANWAKKRA